MRKGERGTERERIRVRNERNTERKSTRRPKGQSGTNKMGEREKER